MKKLILVFLSLFLWTPFVAMADSPKGPPNVLVILLDDLGYSDLGCYGGEIPTPNIDSLARGGVRFEACYTSTRCCPSRASLMTGLYPPQAGIADFVKGQPDERRGPAYLGRLNNQCVTLAEVLKPVGYKTYYVGKWHMTEATDPITRGFDEFYGYTQDHSHSQWDANYYQRKPRGRQKEINPPDGQFYATDVFTDYTVEFIKQGQSAKQPWLVFLGHSSPHFPIQAPKETVDRYEEMYQQGWDVLREARFDRMKQIGLIDSDMWKFTERSLVPVEPERIANGYSGQQNPAWNTLEPDRQRDLARRMALFAAMVDHVDQGIGKIVDHLKKTGDFENTIILFTSDNGACYEWGPFGFDGVSRSGTNLLHTGDELAKMGGAGSYASYGSAWANLGNTPFRLYKHFTHEGGIVSPLIVHWPSGIDSPQQGKWVRTKAHLMDVMPTVCSVTGAEYPKQFRGNDITPTSGINLIPAIQGKTVADRPLFFEHFSAKGVISNGWKAVQPVRMPDENPWELYHLDTDRCETNNLAGEQPEKLRELITLWEGYARRVRIEPFARQIQLVDFHIHLRGGMTVEKAVAAQNQTGFRSGVLENAGAGWPLSDNNKIQGFIDTAKQFPVYVGLQVNDRNWYTAIDTAQLARLDYILADTMILPHFSQTGGPQKLWLENEYTIDDPENWMELYFDHCLNVVSEPITILANPTYLPPRIAPLYDKLWTRQRMEKWIDTAVKNGVAFEIQAKSPFPKESFIRLANEKGAKWTIGRNNFDDTPIDLTDCENTIKKYNLTPFQLEARPLQK